MKETLPTPFPAMLNLLQGDCLEVLKTLSSESVDSIVTDPPYELGFMGKSWDNTGIANNKDMWSECLRVLKPGGHLLSFGGTRTYHRMACAIEDAGFEVRDMIEWCYGSGFPKSLNIGKAVDRLQGNEREITGYDVNTAPDLRDVGAMSKESTGIDKLSFGQNPRPAERKQIELTKGTSAWEGWGTALKPAHEPICMARKPLAEKTVAENCLKYGTGGINIDESRVGTEDSLGRKNNVNPYGSGRTWSVSNTPPQDNTKNPPTGRWPANLLHDNSEEVRECFPNESERFFKSISTISDPIQEWAEKEVVEHREEILDEMKKEYGFIKGKSIIYQAKASKSERNMGCEGLEEKSKVFNGQSDTSSIEMKDLEKRFTTLPTANNHPTVKPIALMEYLITMVTPKGGIVLDPFAGSGSTLIAAKQNGYQYIGIELEPEYIKIAKTRLDSIPERLL